MNISSTSTKNLNSDPEVLVKVENVGKVFCRDLKKSLFYGVKDSVRDLVGRRKTESSSGERPLREGEFWANKGISFELRRGECLGLIGRNGAGKTTLLKMLNGLIKPDTGRIAIRGRVGALIALGAGFNPILTGRENIYVNGSVLGLSKKEIDGKIDEIIDFAEIDEFIDSPVQTYSSGMQIRLGFAVASALSPDVLILDEVLAVGDSGFVVKCLNRIREMAHECAIIFVSHQMQHISNFCSRVVVMDQGMPITDTLNPGDAINCYFGQMTFSGSETGSGHAKLKRFDFIVNDAVSEFDPVIRQGDEIEIEMNLSISRSLGPVFIRFMIDDEAQTPVITYRMLDKSGKRAGPVSGDQQIKLALGPNDLNAGNYTFRVIIADAQNGGIIHLRKSGIAPFRVRSNDLAWSKIVRPVIVD